MSRGQGTVRHEGEAAGYDCPYCAEGLSSLRCIGRGRCRCYLFGIASHVSMRINLISRNRIDRPFPRFLFHRPHFAIAREATDVKLLVLAVTKPSWGRLRFVYYSGWANISREGSI
jgi:hypothetical protein